MVEMNEAVLDIQYALFLVLLTLDHCMDNEGSRGI